MVVDYIVVHCSATQPSFDIGVREIDAWHRSQGWAGCGYHYVVRLNGEVELGRPENVPGAHVSGHNYHSIGVCYVGGLDANGVPSDTRSVLQREGLRRLLRELLEKYPKAVICGHRDLNPHKACPCFDARSEYGCF